MSLDESVKRFDELAKRFQDQLELLSPEKRAQFEKSYAQIQALASQLPPAVFGYRPPTRIVCAAFIVFDDERHN